MRTVLMALTIWFVASLLPGPAAVGQGRKDVNLFGRGMKDWNRESYGKNPWRLMADGGLYCSAVRDTYIHDYELGDGTLAFEYRFRPAAAKAGHKAAVSVRRSAEGGGCTVQLGEKCGLLTASYQGGSDRTRSVEVAPKQEFAKPVGEWSKVEIKMASRSVTVFINGQEASSFDQCTNTQGYIALQAEGWEVEFRQASWKPTK